MVRKNSANRWFRPSDGVFVNIITHKWIKNLTLKPSQIKDAHSIMYRWHHNMHVKVIKNKPSSVLSHQDQGKNLADLHS